MNKLGPIIIIEDDGDDIAIFQEAYDKLNYENELVFFESAHKAYNFLNDTDIIPFLIISDINMPMMDGFELRDKIRSNAELKLKTIPYLFFTTASNEKAVVQAYNLSVQGFFTKPETIQELGEIIDSIMHYWKKCVSPNSFKYSF